MQWIRQAAGERFSAIELSMVITCEITEKRGQRAEQLASERGWSGISVEQVLEMPSMFIGTVDRVAEEMLARRAHYGFSYFVVSDENMETFAPIVARLVGK